MNPVISAAVDLGASSGRVLVGTCDGLSFVLDEVHRFTNESQRLGTHDYWEIAGLWNQVLKGLREAKKRYPGLASIGVDTWGVDHVLLDRKGRLVAPCHAYRDERTGPALQKLAKAKSQMRALYQETGIPNLFYNTSLQLAEWVSAHGEAAPLVARCLLLPDYFNFLLSGRMANEVSIASTSQLLSVREMRWSWKALHHFKVPPRWFRSPVRAGRVLGQVLPGLELGDARLVVAPGHDTACAFAAMPACETGGDLYLSCGTWSLLGFESSLPFVGPEALDAGISNERMGDGRFRPVASVIGLWILEKALRELDERPGGAAEWETLLGAASALPAPPGLLDVADPMFVNPDSMVRAIRQHLRSRQLLMPEDLPSLVRLICDSLAAEHARAMRRFEAITRSPFKRILMVGGGAKNRLLCEATARACGVPLHAFELEGSALGNLGCQWVSLGVFATQAEFRKLVARQVTPRVYLPDA
ncbi:MAG: FGGY family carbohydrate kinase [Opitutaceae bacterium]|nr:FGGY family carbohydrate kinase [Opitutaceae bacterium]